ncbi:cation diffusion facilitator family transporter [Solimonas marina]|uniref:Cation transporter n=1 Tax=Solimonas marina TaxID=2714601 RepID=A0A970B7B4_9GAMM|nr:cation diffusion facilitator family transporter [Solimonas marina]NKF23480.1 cation transporter [Solimonas marina]
MSAGRSRDAASKKVIYVALAGNLAIAITKFVAASLSGSAAMLSEGVHSLVDTGNEVLLLYGMHRARLPPTAQHPLGHARELYFWTFIVALLVFAVGAGVSCYEGVSHLLHPEPLVDARVAYVVLGVSAIFEGISWRLALKEFRGTKGRRSYLRAAEESKDPRTFTVLFEDSAALLGLIIAFLGVFLAHRYDMPALDGIASLCIGVLLAVAAAFLARESKALLVGEGAHPQVERRVATLAAAAPEIRRVNRVLTTQLGPEQVVVAISAEFEDELRTPQIEACVERLESDIRRRDPQVMLLFIKPQSPDVWQRRHGRRNDDPLGVPPVDRAEH